MDAIELMRTLGADLNCVFRPSELDVAIGYFMNMIKDERVIVIYEDSKPHAVMTYSLTDDPDTFLKKATWDYLPQNLLAKTIYVEKLVSKGWNKELRTLFEQMIIKRHPRLEHGIWHRYGLDGDRKVTTKRRLHYV